MTSLTFPAMHSDADLVARAVNGNRDAFGTIVERYQSLVCSIAYSGTGNLTRSEDLAQETFLAAWRQLPGLREPSSLRAWLCGIARNLVNSARRKEGREPIVAAEHIDDHAEAATCAAPLPAAQAISREEESILWRSLERIPDSYREPLVLFYREHQSIARVAESLGVSEDAVKQRLSRGRKLLQEEVAAFVEGALERSSPGKAFTIAVVAALPAMATSASAATVGALLPAASKSGGASFLSALAPFFGALSGFLSAKAALNSARTERERSLALRDTFLIVGGALAFCAIFALALLAGNAFESAPAAFILGGLAVCAGFAVWFTRTIQRSIESARSLRAEELQRVPELIAAVDARHRAAEYISPWKLFGIPLLHHRTGIPQPGTPPAWGWIAIGDRALSPLLAVGGFAAAPISVGAVTIGLATVGVVGLGAFSLSTLALGFVALGSVAVGWHALSGLASFGWSSAASGGLSAARDYALGSHAWAQHANDAAAREALAQAVPAGALQVGFLSLAALTIGVTAWNLWRTGRKSRPSALAREEDHAPESLGPAADTPAADTLASDPRPPRLPALDSLRACLTALVVVHHAVLAYHQYGPKAPPKALNGGSMIWSAFPVVDPQKWPGIDLLVGFNDYFFMALMFLISGLFVQNGLQRKGAGSWFRDRLLRLGLPFVFGAALLAPLAYLPTYLQSGGTPTLAGFWSQWSAIGSWPAGPVWFLWVLLAFGGLAALLHRCAPGWVELPARWIQFSKEHPGRFYALVVLLAALVYLPMSYLINPGHWSSFGPFFLQTARVPAYFLYFVLGLVLGAAGIERSLLASEGRLGRRWMLWSNVSMTVFFASVAAFIWMMVLAGKGQPVGLPYFLSNLGWVLTCAANSFALAAVFVRFGQQPGSFLRSLSANAFAIYLVHYPIVSWVQFALVETPLAGWQKGLLAMTLSLGLSWIVAAGLRRLPGLRRVLS